MALQNYKNVGDDFNAVCMFPVQSHCVIPSAIIRFAWLLDSVVKMKLDDTRSSKWKAKRCNENSHKECFFVLSSKFSRLLQYRQMLLRMVYALLSITKNATMSQSNKNHVVRFSCVWLLILSRYSTEDTLLYAGILYQHFVKVKSELE